MKKAVAIILAVLTLVCLGCASDHVVTDSSAMQELVKEEVVQENDSSLDESIFAEESVTQSESIKELETMPVMTPQESNFEVHYIDVGQADATLVVCDEEYMLIDGGNVEDSNLIYTYLKDREITYLKYMICTHAHEDHVGGLAGALNYAQVETVYCPVADYDTKAFQNFVKYLDKQGKEITIPTVGTSFKLGCATCTIIGVNTITNDLNNTSIVMKIEYGDTSFLFCGDAEQSVETYILDSGYDVSCTVLKVPHHGSDTSLSYRWLNESMPEYGVISVGENNSYGHPCENTLSKLRDADVTVYRTDMQGDIICISDGMGVSFTTQRNSDANTLYNAGPGSKSTSQDSNINSSADETESCYILNINTKKFHYPSCSSVGKMKEENKEETDLSREELISQGYSPCGNCKP